MDPLPFTEVVWEPPMCPVFRFWLAFMNTYLFRSL